MQYDVFFEDDDSDTTTSSSIHKRRIQDTRILSFETNQHGRIFKKDAESGQIVSRLSISIHHFKSYYQPILHVIPRHLAIDRTPYNPSERFVTIIIEPTVLGMTPTVRIEMGMVSFHSLLFHAIPMSLYLLISSRSYRNWYSRSLRAHSVLQ